MKLDNVGTVDRFADKGYEYLRAVLNSLYRVRVKFQKLRTGTGNIVGIKGNGEDQDVDRLTSRAMLPEHSEMFAGIYADAKIQEQDIEKFLSKILPAIPVYEWMDNIAGLGPCIQGALIAHFDIYEATTVSKMWFFAGLCPKEVRGRAYMSLDKAKRSGFKILKTIEGRRGEEKALVLTDTMIKADKKTKGFLCPFNQNLRAVLLGQLASSFIMLNGLPDKNGRNRGLSPYRLIYDKKKAELAKSTRKVLHYTVKGKSAVMTPWCDTSDEHRGDSAARYMIKMFIIDLHKAWREAHGLYVRETYHEAKRGLKHAA